MLLLLLLLLQLLLVIAVAMARADAAAVADRSRDASLNPIRRSRAQHDAVLRWLSLSASSDDVTAMSCGTSDGRCSAAQASGARRVRPASIEEGDTP
jgi:hypothetical protein